MLYCDPVLSILGWQFELPLSFSVESVAPYRNKPEFKQTLCGQSILTHASVSTLIGHMTGLVYILKLGLFEIGSVAAGTP